MIDRAGRGSLFPLINVLSRVLLVIQERICYNHSSFISSNPFFNKIIEGRLNLIIAEILIYNNQIISSEPFEYFTVIILLLANFLEHKYNRLALGSKVFRKSGTLNLLNRRKNY